MKSKVDVQEFFFPVDPSEGLKLVEERSKKGHPDFYKPLPEPHSRAVRDFYRENLKYIPEEGCVCVLTNREETVIARGYTRVVIGDYGAFIEISGGQIALENIRNRWEGEPSRPLKYIWMETRDKTRTKVYRQLGRVKYADYIEGMFYVSPDDIILW